MHALLSTSTHRLALLATATAALSFNAQATTVYDSSSNYTWNTPNPVATSGFNNNITTHPTLAYYANSVVEAGGYISLAGTDRDATSATLQLRTGPVTGPGTTAPAVPDSMSFTLNLYSGLGSGLFATKQVTVTTPSGTGVSGGGIQNNMNNRPFFDINFNLLGVTLPNSFYYGLAFNNNQNTTANSVNLSLWNYGTSPGFGPTDSDYDGAVIKVGTDLSNSYWARTASNTISTTAGFTPNLILGAVPEPGTYAMMLVGLIGVAAVVRRRSVG